jgi:hypothetical protein
MPKLTRLTWPFLSALCLHVLGACTGEVKTTPPVIVPPVVVPRCSGELKIEPQGAKVSILQAVRLRTTGGSGSVVWSFEKNESGALLRSSGEYLSGRTQGTDVIVATDSACETKATVSVVVLAGMTVRPTRVELKPNQAFRFQVTGGSGEHTFTFTNNASTGSISAVGNYVAGAVSGIDQVEVRDSITGETISATLVVNALAKLVPEFAYMALPQGTRTPIQIRGGSGYFDFSIERGTAMGVVDSMLQQYDAANAKLGTDVVKATCRFSGLSTTLNIQVLQSHTFPSVPSGHREETGVLVSGDLDGDGKAEVVLANPESDLNGAYSGAIFIWKDYAAIDAGISDAGAVDGGPPFGPMPSVVLKGQVREERLGSAVLLFDMNNDGRLDLVAGAPRANNAGTSSGRVSVWLGKSGALPSGVPDFEFFGVGNYDYFGSSLAAGDFNGDKKNDLAIGAVLAEDLSASPISYDQGSVFVFHGSDTGFSNRATSILRGVGRVADGGMAPIPSLQFARTLASGDVNHDGTDDLLVGIPLWTDPATGGSARQDGAMSLYLGRKNTDAAPGGLRTTPAFFSSLNGQSALNSYFGARLLLADLNGDSFLEMVTSAYGIDVGPRPDEGQVYVFRGSAFDANHTATKFETASSAAATIQRAVPYMYLGTSLAVGDMNGSGAPSILVGSPGENGEKLYIGRVFSMSASNVFLPDAGVDAGIQIELAGFNYDERLGSSLAVIPNANGAAGLAAFSPNDNLGGHDVGSVTVIPPGTGPLSSRWNARVKLSYPAVQSDALFGRSLAILDFNGDGLKDLAVGAPQVEPLGKVTAEDQGLNAGAVYIYAGLPDGKWSTSPTEILTGFDRHYTYRQAGYSVAVTDYDNDGKDDLAVAMIGDYMPAPEVNGRYNSFAQNPDSGCLNNASTAPHYASGTISIFKGGQLSSGIRQPQFYMTGDKTSQQMGTQLAGDFDFNGDGYGDLISGYQYASESGQYSGVTWIIGGRSPLNDGIKATLVCHSQVLFKFPTDRETAYVGSGVTGLADIDGDGCDEALSGALNAIPKSETVPAGTVTLAFGFGPSCRTTDAGVPNVITLKAPEMSRYQQFGTQVHSAGDVTGDGIADVLISQPQYAGESGDVRGAVWVVSGAKLKLLRGTTMEVSMADLRIAAVQLVGPLNDSGFGLSLGSTVDIDGDGIRDILIGAERHSYNGTATGAVFVYRGGPTISSAPWGILLGDAVEKARFGASITSASPSGLVVVGAPWSNRNGEQNGGAFSGVLKAVP